MNIAKIPLGEWVDFSRLDHRIFCWIIFIYTTVIDGTLNILVEVLSVGPPIVIIIILALLVTYTSRWPLGIFNSLVYC